MTPAYNLLLQYIGVHYVYNIMVMCFMYGDVFYVRIWWCVLCIWCVFYVYGDVLCTVMCFMYMVMCFMYGNVFIYIWCVFYIYGDGRSLNYVIAGRATIHG